MVRQPAVAGQFYPSGAKELRQDLEALVKESAVRQKAIGVIAPHAGYIYSGPVAGLLYGKVEIPRTVVILGPNHYGHGVVAALSPASEWASPLGAVPLNSNLTSLISKHAPFVQEDAVAHQFEHSLEVQLPFLQYIRPDLTILPICLGFGDFARCRLLGNGLAAAIREYGEETLIVASSDMTHYEPAGKAKAKDEMALDHILGLDPEGLLATCRSHGITMCGVIPATVMLIAAMELGATRAELINYATSGDVTGDTRSVVAYAAVAVS